MNASEPREDAVADSVTDAMLIAAQAACVQNGAYFAPETDDEWRKAIAAALAQQRAVAVAWQCRHRGSKAKPWSEWEECDHDSYVDITRRQPVMWEARALIPATGAPR